MGNSSGFKIGDAVLLINLMGIGSSYGNVGNYELAHITGILNNSISLSSITRQYGNNGTNSNLGTTVGTNQIVIIQRIPKFNSVNISGTLNSSAFGLSTGGGIVAIQCNTFMLSGTINVSGCGYPSVYNGHGYGIGVYGGYGAGLYSYLTRGLGGPKGNYAGGGGHIVAGASGWYNSGGGSFDAQSVSKLHFGGGGGARVNDTDVGQQRYAIGGSGGGIVFIIAKSISINGSIYANGSAGSLENGVYTGNVCGGGGAGGSILLEAARMSVGSNTIQAVGSGTYTQGGYGKVITHYNIKSGSLSSNPTASEILI